MKHKRLLIVVGMIMAVTLPVAAEDCRIKKAADLAVQKQLTLIDAAKVNPSDFFNGSNSCISTDLLKSMDLSKLIPDLSGLLTSGAESLVKGVIDKAKQKVCDTLNNQLQDAINKINEKLSSFESSIGSEFAGLLNGNISTITTPGGNSFGQYNLKALDQAALQGVPIEAPAQPSGISYSILSGTGTSAQSASPVQTAPSETVPQYRSNERNGSNFKDIFK